MPSLYGAGVHIRLASQPLAPTLTGQVQLKKGHDASSKCEQAEKALRESVHTFLSEDRVPFPGGEGNFAVNWLGGTQFLQVVVGQPSAKSQQLEARKQRPALSNSYAPPVNGSRPLQGIAARSGRPLSSDDVESEEASPIGRFPAYVAPSPYSSSPNNHEEPEALVLHVMLSDKTFHHSPFNNSPQHLKIDVLFNGQLSSSVLIHTADVRAGAKSLHQIFAGTRIDYMAERPWVMHTPQPGATSGQPAPGLPGTGARDRWAEICRALMNEASERGVNENGDRPPTAAYLQELASMKMPDMVRDLQGPGGMKFGVVDVIVTVGHGKKTVDNVVYLKAPMRLSDDRFCYEVDENGSSESIQASVSSAAPPTFNSDDQDAEGDSNSESPVLAQDTIYRGIPTTSNQGLPLPPPQLALPWHNPFTGSPIRPLAPLVPPTSFTRRSVSFPGAIETLQNRSRLERAGDLHAQGVRQMAPPQRSYPSAHGPSIPPRNSYAPPVPPAGYNLNQYDSFEHANPYQLPYTGMMNGLEFASFDGPASSPLRNGSGGQLTLPSIMQTPEEVIPSPSATSAFSSPYTQSSGPTGRDSGAVFASDDLNAYGSIGYGVMNPSLFLHASIPPGYTLQEMTRSPLRPLGSALRPLSPYASVPYLPPLRTSSNGPPPPVGLFKVTEKLKTPPIEPKAAASGIPVRRLVIRMGVRVVLSHHFTRLRRLPTKASLGVDTSVSPILSMTARKESPGSAEWFEQAAVRQPSNGAAATLANPSNTSTNAVVDLATTTSSNNTKRDSIHDVLTSADVSSATAKVLTPAAQISTAVSNGVPTPVSTIIPSEPYIYVPMHRTAMTGIRGVQGPKANLFVFDNPEELLRKRKSRSQGQSRSVSPTKVDIPIEGAVTGAFQAAESHKVGQPVMSSGVNTRSSSPLSELTNSPQLSTTAESRPETSTNAQVSPATMPPPAIPAPMKPPTGVHTRSFLPKLAPAPSAPLTPSVAPSPILKRKRAPEQTPKRTPAGAYVKTPRSPGRLNARDNPPLNRDCVVQYAVSEFQGGALRQVKCERKGVFKEEDVVVGCRFFVGGC
jgi:hypothetical protein